MYYTVALLSPPWDTLTYALPVWWPKGALALLRPGLRLAVPLGKSLRAAVLLDAGSPSCTVPHGVTVRPFAWILENTPLLDAGYMELARQCALRQGRSVGNVLAHVLPMGLRSIKVRLHHHVDGARYSLARIQDLPESTRAELACALAAADGAAAHTARMLPVGEAHDTVLCVLAADPPWPVRPRAVRQKAILEYLHEHGPLSRKALLAALRHAHSAQATEDPTEGRMGFAHALDTLLRHAHVVLRTSDADTDAENGASLLPQPSFTLSQAQEAAVAAVTRSFDAGRAVCHMLFGVTGSGKTAVYMEIIRACHERGQSALLLAPEVAIAQKLRRDVEQALAHIPVYLYHGYQSAARREELFRQRAVAARPCVVVGTRSALFLPMRDVGVIILDEEHDASYKQDEKLPYHAKEVAWVLATQANVPLLLGSATPDVKTFHAARGGGIVLSSLPERVGGGRMPEMALVHINPAPVRDAEEIALAPESLAALRTVLAKGEQAVVLLNRRGYAPRMYCQDCRTVARCPQCEIALTYHKGRERLLCHYCGHNTPYPAPCVQCAGMRFVPMGEGTEKLAESLRGLTPLHNVLRLDRDSTRRPGRMEEILDSFARQKAQILVGTQMLSKGHHFPNVTLALLADGDLGLNLPDYRAAENTFQLLVQAAGRAGRGAKAGRVLIQTRDTRHYCWDYVLRGDYEGFCAEELARRARRQYPPFVRLALIRMSYSVNSAEGTDALSDISAFVRREGRAAGLTVLGPAPAPIAVIRGRRRFHCLLKSPVGRNDWATLRTLYAKVCQHTSAKNLRLFLDLDPVSML